MSQTEADKTAKLQKLIKEAYPGVSFTYKVNDRIRKGIPDLCVIIDGKTFWLEAKKLLTGTRTELQAAITPLQRRTIDEMRHAGADVWIVAFLPENKVAICDAESLVPIWNSVLEFLNEVVS